MAGAHIRLVGEQCVLRSDFERMMRFYGELFGRLAREVEDTGSLSRYVGYQSRLSETDSLHFLGIEVASIGGIPEGMVAWELDEKSRTVRHAAKGADIIARQDAIDWHWLVESNTVPGRWSGEFTGPLPAGIDSEEPAPREFWVSANCYVRPGVQGHSDEVALADYDPSWPDQAREMAGWLRERLGPDVALRVEHYGSTAIRGMAAKPIVDLLVEVPSFVKARETALRVLDETWEYWWYAHRLIFVKRAGLMGARTYHVHMAPAGHKAWDGIAFRDYLRSHPDDAARYAALKRELAATHREDRERYTQAKAEFVQQVTARALGGEGSRR